MSEAWSAREWENEQMREARLDDRTREATRRLLDAWLAGPGVYGVDVKLAIESFGKLVLGNALVVKDDPDEVWTPVTQAGQVHTRDTVRVRHDAYSDEAGRMHNGRRGRVIAVRYGDVIIRYDDGRQPPFDAVHHPPTRLERLA